MNDEILVPLDLSDAIAMIDRQKEQIAALTAERDRLKAKREIWEERNVSLEGKCAALAAERDEAIRIAKVDREIKEAEKKILIQEIEKNAALTAYKENNYDPAESIRLNGEIIQLKEQIADLITENKRLKGVLRLMANAPLLETAPLQQVKAFIRKAQEALRGGEEKPTPIGDIYNDKIAREIWIGYDSENEEEALGGQGGKGMYITDLWWVLLVIVDVLVISIGIYIIIWESFT